MILNAHAGTKYGVSFPVLVPRQLRRAGRQRAGDPPRAGRLRLVRHPDLDRRPGAEHAARRGVAGVGRSARQRLDRLRHLLGARRSGSSSTASRASRSSKAGRRRCSSAAGVLLLGWAIRRGGGLGHILAESVAAADGARAVLALFPAALTANVGYWATLSLNIPGLHALRAQPAIAGARPGARPAGDDDRVCVHRRGRDQRDDRDLRRGDLGSGRADRAHRQRAGHHLRRAGRDAGASSRPTWPPTSCRRRTTSPASRRAASVTSPAG